MERSGFFNSVNGDRKYKSEDFANYFNKFITNGVFPNPSTNLQVIAGDSMNVVIKAGSAWINGYAYDNTTDLILPVDPADGVLNRIDRVVLRYDTINREIKAKIKKGTFASAPVAPALQRDADAFELALADISIAKGIVSISQAYITDTRLNADLCGIVNSLIQVDTTTLLNQYEAGMQAKEAQFTQDFNTWFATIQGSLDGDTAGNLLNLINNHKADKNNPHEVTAAQIGAASAAELEDLQEDFATHLADYVAQPANGGTTGGTATAYTCSSNPAPTALLDKMGVVITAHLDSGVNPTLQWNTLTAKPIKKPNGNAAVLKKDGVYTLRYNATTGFFILQGEGASGNATASDLLSGKTASTDVGDIVGTLALTGTALASDVATGKTFYNTDAKNKLTGTATYIPITVSAGTNGVIAQDLQATTLSTTYVKAGEFKMIKCKGVVRLGFSVMSQGYMKNGWVTVYKNGVAISQEYTGNSDSPLAVTLDITFNDNDLIQIFAKGDTTTSQSGAFSVWLKVAETLPVYYQRTV